MNKILENVVINVSDASRRDELYNIAKEMIPSDYQLKFDDRDGLIIMSNTGLTYDLLELKPILNAKCRADMYTIFLVAEDIGYVGLIDYVFGTNDLAEILESALPIIKDFESGQHKPLDLAFVDDAIEEDALSQEQIEILLQYQS